MIRMKTVLAALAALMTAAGAVSCGENSGSSLNDTTAAVSETTATVTTEAPAASEPASETVSAETAAPDTTAAGSTTTIAAATETTAETSTTTVTPASLTTTAATVAVTQATESNTAAPQTQPAGTSAAFALPLNVSNAFSSQKEITLSGKGYVYASSGLRLRDQASASGKQLGSVKFGTTVEILGLAVKGDSYDWENNRWYRIKADGKTGYVSADYVAATFSQKPGELSAAELAGMTNFLYCQHLRLFPKFALEGGFTGSVDDSDHQSGDFGDYVRIKPDSLTVDAIYQDFYKYFAKRYHTGELNQSAPNATVFYKTFNDRLYAACPYMEGWEVAGQVANEIIEISDEEITVKAQYTVSSADGGSQTANTVYSMYYEDGYWKAGKSCSIYSSYTDSQ